MYLVIMSIVNLLLYKELEQVQVNNFICFHHTSIVTQIVETDIKCQQHKHSTLMKTLTIFTSPTWCIYREILEK